MNQQFPQQTFNRLPDPAMQRECYGVYQHASHQQDYQQSLGLHNTHPLSNPTSTSANLQSIPAHLICFTDSPNNTPNVAVPANGIMQFAPSAADLHGSSTGYHLQTLQQNTTFQPNYNTNTMCQLRKANGTWVPPVSTATRSARTNHMQMYGSVSSHQPLNGHKIMQTTHQPEISLQQTSQTVQSSQTEQRFCINQGQIRVGNSASYSSDNHSPSTSRGSEYRGHTEESNCIVNHIPATSSFNFQSSSCRAENSVVVNSQINNNMNRSPTFIQQQPPPYNVQHLVIQSHLNQQPQNPALSSHEENVQHQPVFFGDVLKKIQASRQAQQQCNTIPTSSHHSMSSPYDAVARQGNTHPQVLQSNNTIHEIPRTSQDTAFSTPTHETPPTQSNRDSQNMNLNVRLNMLNNQVPVQNPGTGNHSLSAVEMRPGFQIVAFRGETQQNIQGQTTGHSAMVASCQQVQSSASLCSVPANQSEGPQRVSEYQQPALGTDLSRRTQENLSNNLEAPYTVGCDQVHSKGLQITPQINDNNGQGKVQYSMNPAEALELVMAFQRVARQAQRAVAVVSPISQKTARLEQNDVDTILNGSLPKINAVWSCLNKSGNVEKQSNAIIQPKDIIEDPHQMRSSESNKHESITPASDSQSTDIPRLPSSICSSELLKDDQNINSSENRNNVEFSKHGNNEEHTHVIKIIEYLLHKQNTEQLQVNKNIDSSKDGKSIESSVKDKVSKDEQKRDHLIDKQNLETSNVAQNAKSTNMMQSTHNRQNVKSLHDTQNTETSHDGQYRKALDDEQNAECSNNDRRVESLCEGQNIEPLHDEKNTETSHDGQYRKALENEQNAECSNNDRRVESSCEGQNIDPLHDEQNTKTSHGQNMESVDNEQNTTSSNNGNESSNVPAFDLSKVQVPNFTLEKLHDLVKTLEVTPAEKENETITDVKQCILELFWDCSITKFVEKIADTLQLMNLASDVSVKDKHTVVFQHLETHEEYMMLKCNHHILGNETYTPGHQEFKSSWLNVDGQPANIVNVLAEPISDYNLTWYMDNSQLVDDATGILDHVIQVGEYGAKADGETATLSVSGRSDQCITNDNISKDIHEKSINLDDSDCSSHQSMEIEVLSSDDARLIFYKNFNCDLQGKPFQFCQDKGSATPPNHPQPDHELRESEVQSKHPLSDIKFTCPHVKTLKHGDEHFCPRCLEGTPLLDLESCLSPGEPDDQRQSLSPQLSTSNEDPNISICLKSVSMINSDVCILKCNEFETMKSSHTQNQSSDLLTGDSSIQEPLGASCSEADNMTRPIAEKNQESKDLTVVKLSKALSHKENTKTLDLVIPAKAIAKKNPSPPKYPPCKKFNCSKSRLEPVKDDLFKPDVVIKKAKTDHNTTSLNNVQHCKDEKQDKGEEKNYPIKIQLIRHIAQIETVAKEQYKQKSDQSEVLNVTKTTDHSNDVPHNTKAPDVSANVDTSQEKPQNCLKNKNNKLSKKVRFALYGSNGKSGEIVHHCHERKKTSTAPVYVTVSKSFNTTNIDRAYTDMPSAKQKVLSQWTLAQVKPNTSSYKKRKQEEMALKFKIKDLKKQVEDRIPVRHKQLTHDPKRKQTLEELPVTQEPKKLKCSISNRNATTGQCSEQNDC